MKYFLILSFFGVAGYSFADTGNTTSKFLITTSSNRLVYNLLVTLLKTCDLNSQKIIIFDDTFKSETFTAIADIQPQISTLLFSDLDAVMQIRRYKSDDFELDAVILVLELDYAWQDINFFFIRWRYNRNCTVYMIPVPIDDCHYSKTFLKLMMQLYFSAAYYICLQNNQHIRVYTHDPYGDTNPPHWEKIRQEHYWGKNWNFYTRPPITNNTEMGKLCPGFNFNRTDPSNQIFVTSGIYKRQIGPQFVKRKESYGSEIEKDFKQPHRERITLLKKLLKFQFRYYTITSTVDAFDTTGIDLLLTIRSNLIDDDSVDYSHPVEYEAFAILSHNRGIMTPLEKIAKFYGIWTLSSLTVMLSITFIVIRIVTKNTSWAFFDVIRLLINTEIFVPINTWSRKIFFCMVFLYFLVIHATFSGNLAEFLTKVDYRPNIETFEDLKDPRIEKIYSFVYHFNDGEGYDVLWPKLKYISKSKDFSMIIDKKSYVYIAPSAILNQIWMRININNTARFSKKTFGISLFGISYRHGFPLSDKLNWALMYLFDTGFGTRLRELSRQAIATTIAEQNEISYVHHRPITLDDIFFAFILLITGNCVSIICFLVEISLKNVCKKFKNLHRKKSRHIVRIEIQPIDAY